MLIILSNVRKKYERHSKDVGVNFSMFLRRILSDLLYRKNLSHHSCALSQMAAMNELINFRPPNSTKQKIYDWHQKLIELNKEMDSLNQKYLKDLHKEYEKVMFRFMNSNCCSFHIWERRLCGVMKR